MPNPNTFEMLWNNAGTPERITFPCRDSAARALVIHRPMNVVELKRNPDATPGPSRMRGAGFVISHRASGYRIASADRLVDARAFCTVIADPDGASVFDGIDEDGRECRPGAMAYAARIKTDAARLCNARGQTIGR